MVDDEHTRPCDHMLHLVGSVIQPKRPDCFRVRIAVDLDPTICLVFHQETEHIVIGADRDQPYTSDIKRISVPGQPNELGTAMVSPVAAIEDHDAGVHIQRPSPPGNIRQAKNRERTSDFNRASGWPTQ